MCLALRLRISGAIPLLPQPGLHFMDRDNFTISACFFVNCVRCLIPKYSDVLLKFYDFVHPSSKPLASKRTHWNPDFTFLNRPIKMHVKSRKCQRLWNENLFLELTVCKASDAPSRHHIWSKSWWCVPLPCTQLWTNKTQHKEIFSILHQLTASVFRPWCKLHNMEVQQHWTHFCNFKTNYKNYQCRSMTMKARS